MERRLEPELMDDEAQAVAYAQADFSTSNQYFADAFSRACPEARSAIDLGCGPADVTIRVARALPHLIVTAVDGSAPMIALAAAAVREARLDGRIALVCSRLPGLPIERHGFDAVLSKDLLHHLPDPAYLWAEIVRLGRPGACVHVMDLVRPATTGEARRIVETVAGTADRILQDDFYNSLCAAFSLEELGHQLAAAGLDLRVDQVSERHIYIRGRLPHSAP